MKTMFLIKKVSNSYMKSLMGEINMGNAKGLRGLPLFGVLYGL